MRDRTRWLSAAAILFAFATGAGAQPVPPPEELDPSAPLAPLPDLGVEWPDLNTPDTIAPVPGTGEPSASLPPAPDALDASGAGELRYEVVVVGLAGVDGGASLETEFRRQSALLADRRNAANAAQVDRRSRADAELLAELLRSRGYYDAAVVPDVEQNDAGLVIRLAAAPGQQYRFASVELPGLDAAGSEAATLRRSFAVQAGEPVIASHVIAAGVALQVALGEQGFALAKVGDQDIELDPEAKTARLVLPVQPGPLSTFGAIRVSGRPPFSAAHVGRIARFETGQPFRRSRVDDLRRALVATGLVASADVQVVPGSAPNTVDLAVRLEPAPMRTVAGEVGYGTGEGVRVEASWQHRNFFNPEGALTVRGVAGTQEQLAAVQFRRNNFLARDQVLTAQASISHVDRDAFEARTVLLSGQFERQSNFIWHKKWTWGIGADLLATKERGVFDLLTADKSDRTFFIGALNGSLGLDETDDLLDPTRGFRLLGRLGPEFSLDQGGRGYARAQIDASAYRRINDAVVAAARVRLATIAGANLTDIAPSRRLYSGGGGSVRGYGYQRLGPRDIDDDPIGGRGLAEFSLEARVRLKAFGGNFGVVPFLDGGTLSTNATPDFNNWQFGVGLGLRYYSSFGPIRVDVGTPLNPREGDNRVAVTVSLGQAF